MNQLNKTQTLPNLRLSISSGYKACVFLCNYSVPRLAPRHLRALFSSVNTPPVSSSILMGSPNNLKALNPFRKGNIGLDFGSDSGFGSGSASSSSDVESQAAGDVPGRSAMIVLAVPDGLCLLVFAVKLQQKVQDGPSGRGQPFVELTLKKELCFSRYKEFIP